MTGTAADRRGASPEYSVEQSPLGRIVVAPNVPDGYAIFCTTRDFEGRLDGENAGAITRFIRDRFGIECALATCMQVHGKTVRRVSGATGDSPVDARRDAGRSIPWTECDSCDALWSDEAGVALGIKVADCLPVTLIDRNRGVIANIHCGWRGAVQGITSATLDAIEAPSASAWLGPSIRVCCFEVGEEVAARFPPQFVNRDLGPKPHVDIVALTAALLRERGVGPICDSGLCTRCGELFHSYRRDSKRGGRNLAIVAH